VILKVVIKLYSLTTFIDLSKNRRANKLLSILQKDVSLKTYSIIN